MQQHLPLRFAIFLSALWISCAITVIADEARWRQFTDAGLEAYQRGAYGHAVGQLQFALKEAEGFSEEDPRFARSLNNLALLYGALGRYDEAEPIYTRALEIREKNLGEGHPDIAESLNNLAALYKARGRYDQAELMYTRSLVILETALGPEHPHVGRVPEQPWDALSSSRAVR